MNRGSLSIGKILLIAAAVIALLVFARPFISGTGKNNDAALNTNQEVTQGAVDTVVPVDPQTSSEATTPSDSTASDASQEQATEPAPTTVPPAN